MNFKKILAFLPIALCLLIVFGGLSMSGCKQDTVYVTKIDTLVSYKLPNEGPGSTATIAGKWMCNTDFTVDGVCTNFTGWDFINHGLPYGVEINQKGEGQYFDLAQFSGYKLFDIAYDKESGTIAMIQTNPPYKAVYAGKVVENRIKGTWYDGSGNQGDFEWIKK
ncbi:hypothetical protein [Solitalea canadensis]|uniref:Lipoprotein n=1 Tax=Solitalea canadensis (strain ATCC 29591 / DSM 3403 / JCM 21819 / LMG 8368 / NBRC 15130 / NCIMB 12057 / USAM 9D) TaxID=929556 RepID=H8KUW8_SOLCM|nr:hypothetical protein [Solitalea canadensis]AFD07668.1 hypothetical protein Solca_2634 [Solitalea canadensis DSM 3403]